jgi:hypothetical protein
MVYKHLVRNVYKHLVVNPERSKVLWTVYINDMVKWTFVT